MAEKSSTTRSRAPVPAARLRIDEMADRSIGISRGFTCESAESGREVGDLRLVEQVALVDHTAIERCPGIARMQAQVGERWRRLPRLLVAARKVRRDELEGGRKRVVEHHTERRRTLIG